MPPINSLPVHNRVDAVIGHLPPFWFNGIQKLAKEAGVSQTAVRRLIAGTSAPSFALVWRIAKVLEIHLGRPVNPMDLVSVDGTFPNARPCDVVGGCTGCTPPRAYRRSK